MWRHNFTEINHAQKKVKYITIVSLIALETVASQSSATGHERPRDGGQTLLVIKYLHRQVYSLLGI